MRIFSMSVVFAVAMLAAMPLWAGDDEVFANEFEDGGQVRPGTLVVTPLTLQIPEQSSAEFSVRLSAEPGASVAVTVVHASGDVDLAVSGSTGLSFDATNWDQTQVVTIAAADDADDQNGEATFTVDADGYAAISVTATEVDDDQAVEPPALLPLNDTGITGCATVDTNNNPCPAAGYPMQDADVGRDVGAGASDGLAGFSFTKIDAAGVDLPAASSSWDCVRDAVTNLVWEVKATGTAGLRGQDHTYTWYDTDGIANGGNAGTANGGNCQNSDCDTGGYIDAVNTAQLCGASDWRLPTLEELRSIVNYNLHNPAIGTSYFPSAQALPYWSSISSAVDTAQAWVMDFHLGIDTIGQKSNALRVRLVRSAQ